MDHDRRLRCSWDCSTKLDAEKRLALQQEKEALDMKLLEVYVRSPLLMIMANRLMLLLSPFQTEDEGAPRRAAGARR